MTKIKNKARVIVTIIVTTLLGVLYYMLEEFYYSDFGCGCSSTCVGYYPVITSRIIGYVLLISSVLVFIVSIWRFKSISRFWTLPAIMIFVVAFYGNGYLIFNKGGCGYSLNQTIFFINQTKLGDYAKADAETLNLESLRQGKLKGKLLGYSIRDTELTAFRIGEKPLKVQTSFLFWKVPTNIILNDISYGLNTFRNFEAEKTNGQYEFIGGAGMSEKDFIDEFVLTQNISLSKVKNKKIINNTDGTTRFLFELN